MYINIYSGDGKIQTQMRIWKRVIFLERKNIFYSYIINCNFFFIFVIFYLRLEMKCFYKHVALTFYPLINEFET